MITIIGPGALGSFFAVKLWKLLGNVNLLDYKKDRCETLSKNGIILEENGEQIHAFPKLSVDANEFGIQKFVIILVKAFQTKDILKKLVLLCDKDTLVITLQNGIGAADLLSEVISPSNLALGITMHGANKKSDNLVVHAGHGDTIIGPYLRERNERLNELVSILNKAGINAKVEQNIYPILWKKLLINIGINPITAITCLKNGSILNYHELVELQKDCVKEAYFILQKAGIDLETNIDEILTLVEKVCHDTAQNISSMLQDRLNLRDTEIDFINGAIVKKADQLGLNCPINLTLLRLVKFFSKNPCQANPK